MIGHSRLGSAMLTPGIRGLFSNSPALGQLGDNLILQLHSIQPNILIGNLEAKREEHANGITGEGGSLDIEGLVKDPISTSTRWGGRKEDVWASSMCAKCEAVRETVETNMRRMTCIHIWSQTLSVLEVCKQSEEFWVEGVCDCEDVDGEDVALSWAIAAKHMKVQERRATSSWETSWARFEHGSQGGNEIIPANAFAPALDATTRLPRVRRLR